MKKLLSLLLIVGILLSMLIMPVGATGIKEGNADPNGKDIVKAIDETAFWDVNGNAALYPERTVPGDEILIPLVREGFWDGENALINWDGNQKLGPTVRQLNNSKIVPTLHVIKGKAYIRDISLVEFKPTGRIHARAAVRIRFVQDVVTTEEITYNFRMYLSLDNSVTGAFEWFGGRLFNYMVDVYKRDYVFIGDGTIAEASNTQLNVEMDLGNGVSIYRDMYRGDRFYGRAIIEPNDGQDSIASGTTEIVDIIDIKTIDVKINGRVFEFKLYADDPIEYYVYNAGGDYIGTTREMLPYSARYYISKSLLEIPAELANLPDLTEDEKTHGVALTRFLEGLEVEEDALLPN